LVNIASNAAALLAFAATGNVLWLLGGIMMVCNIAGSLLGSHMVIRRGAAFVRRAFLLVVGALIVKTAWDAVKNYL